MQQRLEAMKSAIARLRTPFEKFYESLDDDQKAEMTALERSARAIRAQSPRRPKLHAARDAAMAGRRDRGKAAPERDAARATGRASRMTAFARNTLNFACQPDDKLTPPDRLATAETRLDAMLDAIKQVAPALDDFLATLSEEQKAQFETIGAKRTS